jgi:hypothetical protein
MADSKYHNNWIPEAIAGEVYMKGGRIKVPPQPYRPSTAECIKLVNAMVKQGLVSFQGKEDNEQ